MCSLNSMISNDEDYSIWAGDVNLDITHPNVDGQKQDKKKVRIIPADLDWNLSRKITEDDCKYFWGKSLQGRMEESGWQAHKDYLDDLRKLMNTTAMQVLDEWLGDRAYAERVLLPNQETASSVEQMKASWRADGSLTNSKKMWNVLYKSFEMDKRMVWDKLEMITMKRCRLRYNVVKGDMVRMGANHRNFSFSNGIWQNNKRICCG